jgi:hypothetical protein
VRALTGVVRHCCTVLLGALILAAPAGAGEAGVGSQDRHAEAVVGVCFNYSCQREAAVRIGPHDWWWVAGMLARARSAEQEREVLADVVARLYRVAGRQSPVAADRGGNLQDSGVDGRMDCIDHATSTTRLLVLLAARDMLRFHRVLEPARRTRFILQHFSAVIEERPLAERENDSNLAAFQTAGDGHGEMVQRFAVDSWFVDHGEPAVVLPLAEWLKGGGPNVQ